MKKTKWGNLSWLYSKILRPVILASMNLDFFVVGSRPLSFLFSLKTPKVGVSPAKNGPSLEGSTSESYLASGGNMGTGSSDQVYLQ